MNWKQTSLILLPLLLSCSRPTENAPTSTKGPATPTDKPVVGELTRAVIQNDASRAARLIQMGADVNENVGTESNRITPLLAAIALGNQPMANTLLAKQASTKPSYEGYDAIDYADYLSLDTTLALMKNGK